ncbi:MAG: ImmA/IrrE family metallo-endopeptidase [Bacteroidetes bacterium]|nr:ImmA/IrrE family metallo-endopeptidase [Bacteroidota bacterium]
MANKSILKRGFKAKAEKLAIEHRKELGLHPWEFLCAFKLAEYLKIKVYDILEFVTSTEEINMLSGKNGKNCEWSALTMITQTGNQIIIHNSFHSEARQQSNLMHELAHIICKHKRVKTDYDTLIAAIRAVVNDTGYVNFVSDEFSMESFMVNNLFTYYDADNTTRDTILVNYDPMFFAELDAGIASDIEALFMDEEVFNACLDSDIAFVVEKIVMNTGSTLDQVYKYFLDDDCDRFLQALQTVNSSIISGMYASLFPGGPPPAWISGSPTIDDMRAILCGYATHADMADWLESYTGWNNDIISAILNEYSSTEIHDAISGSVGFGVLRSPLLYHTHILRYLYAISSTNFHTIVDAANKSTLLNMVKTNDPHGLIYWGMQGNMYEVKNILKANYTINSFMMKFTAYYGQTISDAVMAYLDSATAGLREYLKLSELDIYGSKRVGLLRADTTIVRMDYRGSVNVATATVTLTEVFNPVITLGLPNHFYKWELGKTSYELTNHLGNVLTTVSDRKVAHSSNTTTIDYYLADVRSANDYFAYGGGMKGRVWSFNNYRYSINGQEKESELNEDFTTAEYWEYDSRSGRRWNLDCVPTPDKSLYLVFDGNPIMNVDQNGDIFKIGTTDDKAKSDIQSLAKNNKNKDYIKFNDNGEVTLDFGKQKSDKEITRILKKDPGLALIKDLSTAKDAQGKDLNFFYGTEGSTGIGLENPEMQEKVPNYYSNISSMDNKELNIDKDGGYDPRSFILNASTQQYSVSSGFGFKPLDNYDGKVFIGRGIFKAYGLEKYGTRDKEGKYSVETRETLLTVNRAPIIYHELRESLLRTVNGNCYDEAHSKAGGNSGLSRFYPEIKNKK